MEPKVFIIMSTYKREKLLNNCIKSIHYQTFKDWELLVIDDCSEDKTSSILEYWARYDHRIKLISNKTNKGASCKIPYMLACTSKYLAVIDDDDLWEPTYLEEQISGLEKNPTKVMGFTNCWYIKGSRKSLGNFNSTKYYLQIVPSCAVYLTEAYIEIGGWDMELKEYNAELNTYLKLGGLKNFNHIAKPLVTINRNGSTMSSDKKISAEKLLLVINKNWPLFKINKPMLSEYFKIIGLNYIEAGETNEGIMYLRDSIQVTPNFEAIGALVLTSINSNLFLKAYKIYRKLLGHI